ncbi:hypothetical protein BUALT_Bualt04G0042300 [Buddleja alternifolia]|uniref:Auxin efflux carrier family protein n=1 Tax=Buddleja alternifolia TaxID=168488 RepID=A0AAV6XL88_9LAMI|nr:hypothetical protein BUALT_Bualt04G0042300 [Buddleja alternifolia]
MGFLTLLKVASMPILQVLIISLLGAFMATEYLKLLPPDARRSLNTIVFVAFTPSLVFASLAKTVRLEDIISWWFMPVNIGITFVVGAVFGWIAVKIVKPEPHIKGLIVAMCSSGNLGNILLIVVPAICKENGSPFGDKEVCTRVGLSYVSFSMALGAFYIWTYTYNLIRNAGSEYKAMLVAEESSSPSLKEPNKDLEADHKSLLLNNGSDIPSQIKSESAKDNKAAALWGQILATLNQIRQEILAPPVIAAILGLIFGAVTWLRNLLIGENAPLRVIDDSIKLLGDGTIPCITLILGGNLTQGLRKARLRTVMVIAVIGVRYIILPAVGIVVVKTASHFGFLPSDPLYQFVLMIQFVVPPAMNIEECSVLFLWTYLVATLALTGWSTVFMWILS